MIKIKHRVSGEALYTAEGAADIREVVEMAARDGVCLSGADLHGATLSGADLRGIDLRGANLSDANLSGADLRGATLSGAYLSGADLRRATLSGAYLRRITLSSADLRGADLSGADLRRANLSDANLWGADLRGADLSDADLWGADLLGARWNGLAVHGLPSGSLMLTPTCNGWHLRVGCWEGTVDELEALIAGDDWPEARGEEIVQRRPGLQAAVALCRAHMAANPNVIPDLEERWGLTEGEGN